ncbi:MAG: hypothetical protein ACRC5C_06435 [Bacilli bacterium]
MGGEKLTLKQMAFRGTLALSLGVNVYTFLGVMYDTNRITVNSFDIEENKMHKAYKELTYSEMKAMMNVLDRKQLVELNLKESNFRYTLTYAHDALYQQDVPVYFQNGNYYVMFGEREVYRILDADELEFVGLLIGN